MRRQPGRLEKLHHEEVEAGTSSGPVKGEHEDEDHGDEGVVVRRKLDFSDAELSRVGARGRPGVADAEEDLLQRAYSSNSHPNISFYSYHSKMPSRGPRPPRAVRITDLRPDLHYGTWQTTGRVVNKSSVRLYNNENGRGSYFWFEIKDNDGGEIHVVCFNRCVGRFFEMVVKGKEYVFRNSKLQKPDDQHNWKKRPCEMILGDNSVIRAVREDGGTEGVESKTPTAGATRTQKETQHTQSDKETEYTQTQNENEHLRNRLAEVERKFEIMNSQLLDCKLQIEQLKAKDCAVSL